MSKRHISRGIDYLNDLGAKLRDLTGFMTLAHELIQNADDAPRATEMAFDVCGDALVVDNNGVFSDCGNAEGPVASCALKAKEDYMCDFHRFRLVASGDKRGQEGMTGAFGIGFISVYQITDHPELISGSWHWRLDETQPEDKRIEICNGCELCSGPSLPGTRFILPWARSGDSAMRSALNVPAVSSDCDGLLLAELERVVPAAMIFLKKLTTIELRVEGEQKVRFERTGDSGQVLIARGDPAVDRVWHLLHGEFEDEAAELRARYPRLIEKKRGHKVTIAIPQQGPCTGVLCAFLPTQHLTGLPFHVNGDFFPNNERRRILMAGEGENDYQSDWNRTVIKTAAGVLADALPTLPSSLGAVTLWELMQAVRSVAEEAKKGQREDVLGGFWKAVSARVAEVDVVFTATGEWRKPEDVLLLLEKREEDTALQLLAGLGLSIVNPDLRPFHGLLREIGVALLDASHVVEALEAAGLTARVEIDSLPEVLRTEEGRETLWRELTTLRARPRRAEQQAACVAQLAACAVAPGRDGALWPCQALFRADAATIALFSRLESPPPFLAESESFSGLADLCREFTAEAAIDLLSEAEEDLSTALVDGALSAAELLGWFEDRRGEILENEETRDSLAALPIFPSASGCRPLAELALPGGFVDTIGLAELVDLDHLGGRREFLKELGARELTLETYVRVHVPRAFAAGGLSVEQKRQTVRLLADNLGRIREYEDARRRLRELEIVECRDGEFRAPSAVYLRTPMVVELLADRVAYARSDRDHGAAIEELYRWLRVSSVPRDEDVMAVVRDATAGPPDAARRGQILRVFTHLAGQTHETIRRSPLLQRLRTIPWLPAHGDTEQWHLPSAVYATFRQYLFQSQARFLDVPQPVQQAAQSSGLMAWLGLPVEPTVELVVKHLVHCAENSQAVNKQVYSFLNDHAAEPPISRLRGQKCLILQDGGYVEPERVFWGEHHFGRFRMRLSADLRRYAELFDALGVKECPDHEDALRVIDEIAQIYTPTNSHVPDEDAAVLVTCWAMLARALESAEVDEGKIDSLRSRKCIRSGQRILYQPQYLFFEDRAGLAEKFGGHLSNIVIERHPEAWPAMALAGVQSLREASLSEIVECTDPVEAHDVMDCIRARRPELLRVLEPQLGYAAAIERLDRLAEIMCNSVAELSIRYSLRIIGQLRHSPPEDVPAHLRREDSALFFVRTNGRTPWASISRELAAVLAPEKDPGTIASAVKEVLGAESDEIARATLDELGFAALAQETSVPPGEEEPVTDLGGEEGETAEVPPAPPVSSGEPPAEGEPEMSPGDAVEQLLGGAPPPGPVPPDLRDKEREPVGPDKGKIGKTSGKPPSGKKGYSKLRTYVVPDSDDKEDDKKGDIPQRSPVDRAGVDRVLAYESDPKVGRHPKEMAHFHPGYDVESRDDAGNIVRYIEVKSLSGYWSDSAAGVTRRQFDTGNEKGTRFWLYVVERAQEEDAQIYRIPNPAQQVNQFLYDDGWAALAEPDTESAEGEDV